MLYRFIFPVSPVVAAIIRDMGGSTRPGLQLDPDHASFMQGGVSIVVSARSAGLVPDVVRACGCRVASDRRRVTVLLDSTRAGSVLEHIAANGQVAVVFSQPSTHRTIQLKGSDARRVRITGADRSLAAQHLQAWSDDMQSFGYPADFSRAVHGDAWDRLAAITFTPVAAYEQTPGPGAGQALAR